MTAGRHRRGGGTVDGVSTWEHLLVEDVEPITRITLNRPERRNALSLDLMRELQAALRAGRRAGSS